MLKAEGVMASAVVEGGAPAGRNAFDGGNDRREVRCRPVNGLLGKANA